MTYEANDPSKHMLKFGCYRSDFFKQKGSLSMAKSKKKKSAARTTQTARPQVTLTDEQYIQRLLVLLEARDAHDHDQNTYFDLGGGERPQIVKAEFDLVARREQIKVLVHPVKGKRTLAFVFVPETKPEPKVIILDAGGKVKYRSGE